VYTLTLKLQNVELGGLDRLADTAPLARSVFPRAHETLVAIVENVFAQEGDPSWQALADMTLWDRVSHGFAEGPILMRTGELLRSFTDSGHPFHVDERRYSFRESTMTFGSADPRAVPLGEGLPEDNLPARPMFPPADVIANELSESSMLR